MEPSRLPEIVHEAHAAQHFHQANAPLQMPLI